MIRMSRGHIPGLVLQNKSPFWSAILAIAEVRLLFGPKDVLTPTIEDVVFVLLLDSRKLIEE